MASIQRLLEVVLSLLLRSKHTAAEHDDFPTLIIISRFTRLDCNTYRLGPLNRTLGLEDGEKVNSKSASARIAKERDDAGFERISRFFLIRQECGLD